MSNSTKPAWLKKKINLKDNTNLMKKLSSHSLHTICEEALCPNISECFKKGIATFLIMGDVCTRLCGFCGVKKGKPGPLDKNEPERVAQLIDKLGLKYVVITSVTRDDLPDGGASHFVETIKCIKSLNKGIKIEVLIPDFGADEVSIKKVLDAAPDVIAHNIETVKNIYPKINRGVAQYEQSLKVLEIIKKLDNDMITKSGLMLGLGENEEEVYQAMRDLRKVGCDFLSIGQFLTPSKKHVQVEEFVKPEVFDLYRDKALSIGFKFVKSAPYVRSSYLADEYHCV